MKQTEKKYLPLYFKNPGLNKNKLTNKTEAKKSKFKMINDHRTFTDQAPKEN